MRVCCIVLHFFPSLIAGLVADLVVYMIHVPVFTLIADCVCNVCVSSYMTERLFDKRSGAGVFDMVIKFITQIFTILIYFGHNTSHQSKVWLK